MPEHIRPISTVLRWVFVLLICFAQVHAAHAQTAPSSAQSLRKRMALAVDTTSKQGIHAKLPPHISTLLGLSSEQECPVLQAIFRSANHVQGFDVSSTNHNDVIIFTVDETTNNQTLYLTSKDGMLRKVVLVQQGVGEVQKITGTMRNAFAKEKQFWLDRLAPLP
ncbi:MAG TPA: hypothetical protein VMJ35_08735 [Dongiaceae bacterium]|nr:hypothetical protein [Dongiaceae bacterium]